mgnify:FL=1
MTATSAPYRTLEAPVVTPLTDDELIEAALRATLSALRDLDGDQTRGVLLAVSALYSLDLAHVGSADDDLGPRLTVSDVERLLKAARGTP